MSTLRFARLITLCLVAATVLASDAGVLHRFPLTSKTMKQWRLPDRLNEISGLALTDDQRLLTVDDEIAVVYEVDYDDGRLVKAFAFGDPTLRADFEGIAVADGLVYLLTSDARVFVAAEGADGQRVTFDKFDTELGHNCEFEGLADSPDGDKLYLLCKVRKKGSDIAALSIFAWSIEAREWLQAESVTLPERDIVRALKFDRFSPSGLTVDDRTGNFIIIAARQRSVVEITPDGTLVTARNLLLSARHRQAEGIELTDDRQLLISDEGGNHRARLAVYCQEDAQNACND